MQLYTYIQKLQSPDGNTIVVTHKCEILHYVGRTSVKIRIVGSFYNGRLNATPTVRIRSIKELRNQRHHSNGEANKLPYKD